MSQTKSSRRWLKEHFQDPYVKQAQAQGYRSRAVFKLIEIQEKDKLIHPGMTIVELGAAPGGWSQIIQQWVGKKGRIIATDILPMDPLAGVEFFQGDLNQDETIEKLQDLLGVERADGILSDIAPNLSGDRSIDLPRVMQLAEMSLEVARLLLKPSGFYLVKVFQGEGFDAFLRELRILFNKVVIRKPEASRKRSPEIYLLAKGFRGDSNSSSFQ